MQYLLTGFNFEKFIWGQARELFIEFNMLRHH